MVVRELQRVAGCYWVALHPHRAASGLADVPLTAEHYAVTRGDYAEVLGGWECPVSRDSTTESGQQDQSLASDTTMYIYIYIVHS